MPSLTLGFVGRAFHAAALTFVLSSAALAQTNYVENFENLGNVPIGGWGPQGLINRGWTFENNSEPLGPVAWVPGCCWGGIIQPLSGTGYLAAYQDSAAGGNPQYSAWAILPPVPGQQAGDRFGFYTISSDTSPFDNVSLQVRYSPSGGINVGTTAADVGDFTQVVHDIPVMPNYNEGLADGWTYWEFTLPGPGRLALRQYGNSSLYFGIEDITIQAPLPPSGPLPEDFENLGGVCGEGPCRLIDDGWIFRDQGSLATGPAWQPPYAVNEFDAHSGFSFMKSLKAAGNGGSISTWAILPDVQQQAGDVLTFFVRGALQEDGVFEVRHSPSGGIATGAGAADVGDFTGMLTQMTILPYDGWQEVNVVMPAGGGRLALRVYDPYQPFFDYATIVAVDTMGINAKNPGPPLPAAGETVTWTAAMSPIDIDSSLFIPPGGTVIVEPGVQINIAAEATLSIGGTLQGDGTAASPVTIDSVANFPPGLSVTGTLDLSFAEINTNVRPDYHGSLLFDHCTFAGPNAYIFNPSILIVSDDDAPPFISIEHCTFENGNLLSSDATLRLTNSTFVNGASALPLRGYVYVDNLDIDGGSLSISRDQQNVYIDNITVQNSPGPGINVGGSNVGNDYFFGANNVLSNNAYPASASAGILPGSVLPQSGNNVNAVLLQPVGFEIFGPVTWADPGIPYHVDQSPFLVGGFDLLPGVTMKFQPGHGFAETSGFEARGLPGNPVTFEALSGPWYGIFTPQRLEYSVVDGSQYGIINDALGLPGFFDNCVFSHNARAQVGGAIIRKSQFLNNDIGANIGFTMDLDGQTNPNWFQGNSLAVQDASDATHNWWGHPTGPSGPQNPGGQGDPVAAGVPVIPFRTTPPDLQNHPPIIDMQEIYFVAAPGSMIIINWNTIDADLASHRVLVSTQSDVPDQYEVVAENLPASRRSYALTVPDGPFVFGVYYVRVEGIDALGQIGWDRKVSSAKAVAFDPSMVPPLDPPAMHHIVGHPVPLDDDVTHFETGWVLLDGQMVFESFGAAGVLPTVVDASTDSVRFGLIGDDGWAFSNYFTVRPDERIGDEPPTVQLQSPQAGSFPGGSSVNISWSASDDEAVRSATIQSSCDGGLTYHDVVRRLPTGQSTYLWRLPPLEQGIRDVRLRVVVEDLRFQNSSATSGPLTFLPGANGLPGDITGDGVVNIDDLLAVIAAWGTCAAPPAPCPADVVVDGQVNIDDLLMVISNWS